MCDELPFPGFSVEYIYTQLNKPTIATFTILPKPMTVEEFEKYVGVIVDSQLSNTTIKRHPVTNAITVEQNGETILTTKEIRNAHFEKALVGLNQKIVEYKTILSDAGFIGVGLYDPLIPLSTILNKTR